MATEKKPAASINFKEVARLVKKVQKGNAKAYVRLYDLYFSPIFFTTLRYLKDEQESAEVTQDVFVKAYQSIGTLKDPQAFHKWINRIAYNLSLNKLTRKGNQDVETVSRDITTYEDDLSVDREDFLPENYLDLKEGRDFVLALVDGLPDAQRTAVTMYYFDGLSIADIAEITESSSGTVRKRLHDAKTTLRRRVDERDKGDTVMRYGAAAIPVLTGIMQFGANDAATEALKQSVYKGVATTLGATGAALPLTLANVKPSWSSAVVKAGVATGLTGAVVAGGIMYVNSISSPEPPAPSPVVEQKEAPTQKAPTQQEATPKPEEPKAPQEQPAPTPQRTPEEEPEMPATVPVEKPATTVKTPPQITVAHTTLVYPLGEKVSLKQLLHDAGIVVTDASGNKISFEADYYETIDFFTEGSYALPINATDSQGVAARTAVIVVYITSDPSGQ